MDSNILKSIFVFIQYDTCLFKLAVVSKTWYSLVHDPSFWEHYHDVTTSAVKDPKTCVDSLFSWVFYLERSFTSTDSDLISETAFNVLQALYKHTRVSVVTRADVSKIKMLDDIEDIAIRVDFPLIANVDVANDSVTTAPCLVSSKTEPDMDGSADIYKFSISFLSGDNGQLLNNFQLSDARRWVSYQKISKTFYEDEDGNTPTAEEFENGKHFIDAFINYSGLIEVGELVLPLLTYLHSNYFKDQAWKHFIFHETCPTSYKWLNYVRKRIKRLESIVFLIEDIARDKKIDLFDRILQSGIIREEEAYESIAILKLSDIDIFNRLIKYMLDHKWTDVPRRKPDIFTDGYPLNSVKMAITCGFKCQPEYAYMTLKSDLEVNYEILDFMKEELKLYTPLDLRIQQSEDKRSVLNILLLFDSEEQHKAVEPILKSIPSEIQSIAGNTIPLSYKPMVFNWENNSISATKQIFSGIDLVLHFTNVSNDCSHYKKTLDFLYKLGIIYIIAYVDNTVHSDRLEFMEHLYEVFKNDERMKLVIIQEGNLMQRISDAAKLTVATVKRENQNSGCGACTLQ
jgi:hypothetical protein